MTRPATLGVSSQCGPAFWLPYAGLVVGANLGSCGGDGSSTTYVPDASTMDGAGGGGKGGGADDCMPGDECGGAGGAGGGGGEAGSDPVNPSCAGLPTDCGPSGSDDCCASAVVPGGTFNRSNDVLYPATISTFRLDLYEVTAGRFRKFVDAYSDGWRPSAGSGKNPNVVGDPGWNDAWTNGNLPASLGAAVSCDAPLQTWTGDNDARPMNCISWWEAFAFCIWDNGRLPTEAEWNFAAAGGAEQRVYPWSIPSTSTVIDASHASYHVDGTTGCYGDLVNGCAITDLIVVGTKPAGNARWGHADMSGNVWEWTLDWAQDYISQCVDCAITASGTFRMTRGGGIDYDSSYLRTAQRWGVDVAISRYSNLGVRCARTP